MREVDWSTKVSFFGVDNVRDYPCPGGDGYRWRTGARPGQTWEWDCGKAHRTATVVGDEQVQVDGKDVTAHHVRVTSQVGTDDLWLAASGLPLRVHSTLGDGTFYEHEYDYRLASLEPVSG